VDDSAVVWLLIEIGNTALKAAWSDGLTLGKIYRYQGEKIVDFIVSLTEQQRPQVMTIAAAEPVSAETEAVLQKCCSHLIFLDADHRQALSGFSLPDYLSCDRAASIIAARFLFPGKSTCIFDFGSTLTIDFTDAEGGYLGGNISLGFRTRFQALNRYSRSLPLVNTPEAPQELGDSVETSIAAGVVSGMLFELDGYIRSHPDAMLIFTGGDANYFAKKMKNSIFVVCNLVLMGLALITDAFVRKNN